MELQHITPEEFEKEVLQAKKLVLVDFFATWCGPCKMLGPVLEGVQDELGDDAKIVKYDIDQDVEIAKKYGIMSVPTMIVVKNGQEVDRIVGLRQKQQILDVLKKYI